MHVSFILTRSLNKKFLDQRMFLRKLFGRGPRPWVVPGSLQISEQCVDARRVNDPEVQLKLLCEYASNRVTAVLIAKSCSRYKRPIPDSWPMLFKCAAFSNSNEFVSRYFPSVSSSPKCSRQVSRGGACGEWFTSAVLLDPKKTKRFFIRHARVTFLVAGSRRKFVCHFGWPSRKSCSCLGRGSLHFPILAETSFTCHVRQGSTCALSCRGSKSGVVPTSPERAWCHPNIRRSKIQVFKYSV